MSNSKFTTIRQAKKLAKKKLIKGKYQWLTSGAEDELTTNKNIKDLNRIKIIPNVLKKIKSINYNKKFLGKNIRSPIILSPMGHQSQFHKLGETEMAKGISNYGTVGFFSTQSRFDFNYIRKRNKNCLLVWQIFLFGEKKWILEEIKKAEKNNSLAIAICLDGSIRSHRYNDRETFYDARKYGVFKIKLPPDQTKDRSYGWEIIKWIKSKTKLPIILKGIINYKDVKIAIKYGIRNIWISNHGGRMLNTGISSAEALIKIKKKINKKIFIIVDGGVSRGSDIIKYLCLGADVVGIGRPAIYGLTLNGYKGVNEIFQILESEFRSAMINAKFSSLKDLNSNKISHNIEEY